MMKNIINTIKALIKTHKTHTESVKCNYANDYYGDQLCR